MNEDKKRYIIIAVVLVVSLCTGAWLLHRYYDRSAAADGHDATVTVQQIERDNERARDDVDESQNINRDTQAELDCGQTDIAAAQQSASRLSDSLDERAAAIESAEQQIDRSEQLISEERGIFADIENANPGIRAQAGSN
jgi:peptidoglycan hydrolase CwlO-like protein